MASLNNFPSRTVTKNTDGVRYGAALTSSTTDILSNVSSHIAGGYPVSLIVCRALSFFSGQPRQSNGLGTIPAWSAGGKEPYWIGRAAQLFAILVGERQCLVGWSGFNGK